MKQKHLRQKRTGLGMVSAGKIKITKASLQKVPKNDITKLRNRVSFVAAKKAGVINTNKNSGEAFKLSKSDFKSALTIKNAPNSFASQKAGFRSKEKTKLIVKSGTINDFKATDSKFKKVGIVGNAIAEKLEDNIKTTKDISKDDGGIKTADLIASGINRSAARNDDRKAKYKAVKKAANKEIKALKKEDKLARKADKNGEGFKYAATASVAAKKKGLNYNHKQITQTRDVSHTESGNVFRSTTKKEISFKTKNDVSAKVVFKTRNSGVASSDKTFKNRAAGTDDVRFKDRAEKLNTAKEIKKLSKSGMRKEAVMAAAKRSIANKFSGFSKFQKDLVNGQITGDPLADGNNVVMQGVQNRIKAMLMKLFNKIKAAIKRAIITILSNLVILILPVIPVLVIVIAVVSIIPFMNADPDKIGDTIPRCNDQVVKSYVPHSSLTYDQIWTYTNYATSALGLTFIEPRNFDTLEESVYASTEAKTIPIADRKNLARLIFGALCEVGDDYCQIHRHGEMPPAGSYCSYLDEHSNHLLSHTGRRSFDCSGFVSTMYSTYCRKQLGYRGSDTAANIALGLTEENRGFRSKTGSEMLPGDLIFYQSNKGSDYLGITHVALYIGRGVAVEAYSSMKGVIINSVHSRDSIIFIGRPLYVESDSMPDPDEDDLDDVD